MHNLIEGITMLRNGNHYASEVQYMPLTMPPDMVASCRYKNRKYNTRLEASGKGA